ncbi:AraC family transcriptional regulator [Anaerococcus murdochii]|uniref:AraC family transcriptional regulator n=1 Tax=Anaerococcus murdochii TaxID=411577 RepID=A0ABS7SZJ2_9FIRM|nr:AraC family transcriptional regulator [Anaerococcus murdochii]MBZ2386959.1 AraC family transcriptional regulator [Anaerococcus murdochii]
MEKNIDIEFKADNINIETTHYHNNFEIIFITKGTSTFLIENRKIKTQKNSLVLISNLENHSMTIDETPYERYVINLDNFLKINLLPSEIYTKTLQNRPKNFPYIFKFDDEVAQVISQILNLLLKEKSTEEFSDHYESLLINQLLIMVYRSNPDFFKNTKTDFENTIYKIQDYINENYIKDINLDLIENKFYINKYEVSRNFKKITGYNFKTYLILVRLSRAKDLLVNSNLTIAEISAEIGYNSESLFVRMFKKYENTTPTRYRRAYKNP